MKYGGGITVRKLAAEYMLSSDEVFPYRNCKVRVWHDVSDGLYYSFGNIMIRDTDSSPDSICGIGKSESDSLDDFIANFLELTAQYEKKFERRLGEQDYVYSDPQDF